MKDVYVSISDLDTTEHIHQYFSQTFDFPSYYGRNLDALYDMMTSIGDTSVVIGCEGRKFSELPACTVACLRVLSDAAEENERLHIRCTDIDETSEDDEDDVCRIPEGDDGGADACAAPEDGEGGYDAFMIPEGNDGEDDAYGIPDEDAGASDEEEED